MMARRRGERKMDVVTPWSNPGKCQDFLSQRQKTTHNWSGRTPVPTMLLTLEVYQVRFVSRLNLQVSAPDHKLRERYAGPTAAGEIPAPTMTIDKPATFTVSVFTRHFPACSKREDSQWKRCNCRESLYIYEHGRTAIGPPKPDHGLGRRTGPPEIVSLTRPAWLDRRDDLWQNSGRRR